MTALTKRGPASPLTELFDWVESGWPGMADLRRDASRMMRIEDRTEDDRYIVRAEIPGIDPEKDVTITMAEGILTIAAERREELQEKDRSEFHYGSFVRRVALPQGAKEDEVSATYKDGMLEVTVPLSPAKPEARTIPVSRPPAD